MANIARKQSRKGITTMGSGQLLCCVLERIWEDLRDAWS